jgi:hypothetical protein
VSVRDYFLSCPTLFKSTRINLLTNGLSILERFSPNFGMPKN